MDGSEISSGQGKGDAQVFGQNQALGLAEKYDMNRIKANQKQMADLTKKGDNIDYNGTRPGDAAAFAKQGETVKNLWTGAMAQGSASGRAAAMQQYNGALAGLKNDIATSKNMLIQHGARINNGLKMQAEDTPDGYNDKTDKLLTTDLHDPSVTQLMDGTDMQAIPHYNLDASRKYAQEAYTHESGTTSSAVTTNNGEKGVWNSSSKGLDVDQAHDHFENDYQNDPSMKRQIDNYQKLIGPSDLAFYQQKYGADKVKNVHDAAIWHNVDNINSAPVVNKVWKGKNSSNVTVKIGDGAPPTPENGQAEPNVNLPGTAIDRTTGKAVSFTQNIKDFVPHASKLVGIIPQEALDLKTNAPMDNAMIKNATSYGTGSKLFYKKGAQMEVTTTVRDKATGKSKDTTKMVDVGGTAILPATESRILADPKLRNKVEAFKGDFMSAKGDHPEDEDKNFFVKAQNIPLTDYESKGKKFANTAIKNRNDAALAQNKASAKADGGQSTRTIDQVNANNAKLASAPQPKVNTPTKPLKVRSAGKIAAIKGMEGLY